MFPLATLLQGLTRDDAQAALLLAAADSTPGHSSSPVEGRLEDALLRAATCMDVGGCAKLWRDQHAPPPAVVDLRDEAADAAQQEQQERARQVREGAAGRASQVLVLCLAARPERVQCRYGQFHDAASQLPPA